ncbi:MAG: site-specific integrase [Burkholderiales bacterium]
MASITKRRRKDGGTSWDAMIRVRGYPTRCKSFRTRLEAENWASRTEAAAYGRTLVLGRDVTLAQLLDEAEPKLRRPVGAALAYWRAHLGDVRLIDVTPILIARHRDLLLGAPTKAHGHKRTRPRSAGTVRSYLSYLSSLFTIAVKDLRWCESNPVAQVTLPKPAPGRTRFLSDDERTALLASCRASEAPALYAFVLFALTTGARRGEIAGLRWTDLDLGRRWAIFPKTKNGDARGVPLVQSVVDELGKLPKVGELVFPQDMGRAWDTAVRRADLVGFRFHDLRHSAASRLVQNGANLAEIAALLGHKDIRMTRRYSHVHNAHTLALVDRVMGSLQ